MSPATKSRQKANPMLRLALNGAEMEVLEKTAAGFKMELEDLIVYQLRRFGKAEIGAFLISSDEIRSLQKTLGRNFQSEEGGLAKAVANLATVRIDGLEIQLPENLIQRLKSRCIHQPDFREWLRGVIVTELQRYVGLR